MKNRSVPSAETVGLNSGYFELTFGPRFSILMIVAAVIIFSFCAFKVPVVSPDASLGAWAVACCRAADKIRIGIAFFTELDLVQ